MPPRIKRKASQNVWLANLNWSAILWVLLVGNIGAGLWLSPLTALRKVRVVGALPVDQERIRRILERQRGIPFARVSVPAVESWTLERPDTRTVSLSGNILGSGLLTVRYRRAVARFEGTKSLALSVDGVIYPTDQDLSGLPSIVLPQKGLPLSACLVGTWPATQIAKLAIEAPGAMQASMGTQNLQIKFIESGDLCLNEGSGTVRLGSAENLDKKLSVLQERLARNPQELDQVEQLVLVSPNHPAKILGSLARTLKKKPEPNGGAQ